MADVRRLSLGMLKQRLAAALGAESAAFEALAEALDARDEARLAEALDALAGCSDTTRNAAQAAILAWLFEVDGRPSLLEMTGPSTAIH
jgi:glycosyltransferase A (GT-A) superfamily protein (DUF2064 family)